MTTDLTLTVTGITLTIFGLALSVAAYLHGLRTSRDRARFEALLRVSLSKANESVDSVRRNAELAYSHLDIIRRYLQGLPPSAGLSGVLDRMTWLHGDVVASHRLLGMLRRELSVLAQGLTANRGPSAGGPK